MTCAYIVTLLLLTMSECTSSTFNVLKSMSVFTLDMYEYTSIGHHPGPKHPWLVPFRMQMSGPLIVPLLGEVHWEEARH